MTLGDEVMVRLAVIESKLDAALSSDADHEQRLRRIEATLWKAVGAASVAGGGLAALAQSLLG